MKKLFGILSMSLIALSLILVSCSKEEEWTDVDNFVEKTYLEMREGPLGGHFKCYKAVFPISISFPDGAVVEVGDREELVTVLKNWKEDNPNAEERPELIYPIEVELFNDSMLVIENKEQLHLLRKRCKVRRHAHRAARHFAKFLDNACFEVELPISMVFDNGDLVEIYDRSDIRDLLKAWKDNRPDDRPEIVFPITLNLKEDNTEVEVGSFEELEAIVEDCKG